MNNELNTNPLVDPEERMITLAIKTIGVVLGILFLGISTCSIHGNAYEADVISAKAKLAVEQTKQEEADAKVRIEKINAMERMVNSGVNPIAIRCMDKGWNNDNTCLAVGLEIGNGRGIE